MLEGLPPNNAAHMMRLVCDERRARAIADLVVESFEPAETAPVVGDRWIAQKFFQHRLVVAA